MASAILRCLTVEQALQLRPAGPLIRVRGDAPLGELVERFALSTQECFPIVDENEQLTGIIESRDIRRTITELGMADLIIARDLEVPASTIMPQDSLLSAVNTLAKSGREELVVCDPQDQQKILGIVSRGDVINCYNRQIAAAT
jgi:CBS-domain-containing membrane protein